MTIGNGPDYYNGNVPDEDEQIKLYDKIEKWWCILSEAFKRELMENFYPDDSNLMNVDEMWDGLSQLDKISIWEENRWWKKDTT